MCNFSEFNSKSRSERLLMSEFRIESVNQTVLSAKLALSRRVLYYTLRWPLVRCRTAPSSPEELSAGTASIFPRLPPSNPHNRANYSEFYFFSHHMSWKISIPMCVDQSAWISRPHYSIALGNRQEGHPRLPFPRVCRGARREEAMREQNKQRLSFVCV